MEIPEYIHRLKPREYQDKVFKEVRDKDSYAILWEQGIGKSKIDVDMFSWKYLCRQVNGLVVTAPNGVHFNWGDDRQDHHDEYLGEVLKHVPKHLLEKVAIHIYQASKAGTKKARAEFDRVRLHKGLAVLCISYDAIITDRGFAALKEFLTTRPCMWTIDESRAIKEWSSIRTKKIIQLAPFAKVRTALDGTPMANGPFEIFFPLYFLDPTFWARNGFGGRTPSQQYRAFKSYFGEWTIGYAPGGRQFPKMVRYRHMDHLKGMLTQCSSRLIKDDVLTELPPKLYVPRNFELSASQRKDYDVLDNELDEILSAGEDVSGRIKIQNALTKILRMREITAGYIRQDGEVIHRYEENPRAEAFRANTESYTEQGIVWCEFHPDIEILMEIFGKKCKAYHGKMSDDERQASKRAFLDGGVQWLVATTPSMKKGHTYVNAKRCDYYTTSHDLDARMQSEDRAHRLGQIDVVTYYDYIALNSIDESIRACHFHKETLQSFLLGDKRKSSRAPLTIDGDRDTMLFVGST